MRQRSRSQEDLLQSTGEANVLPATAAVEAPPRQVRLIAGADVQDMDLAGRTVGEARAVARAVFGIHEEAQALIDGRTATEDQQLGPGQVLEFVKHAGQKGAAGASGRPAGGAKEAVLEVAGERVLWRSGDRSLGSTTIKDLVERIESRGPAEEGWRLHPQHVRLMVERGGGQTVGLVIEMPPGPRRVSWIADDSPAPYGPDARYELRRLSFPWVVLLLVLVDGELSGLQQAFFRNAPIGSLDDELYYTNLLNVAAGYGQESWVCLVKLRGELGELAWGERIRAVIDHFWQASNTRSSEEHEGHSFWSKGRGVDRRFASATAWEAATLEDPYFALSVRWRRAPSRLGATLARMLERAAPRRPIERVEQLVTLMQQEEG